MSVTDNIKQFVTQDECRICDGCCRFSDEMSAWRPLASVKEAECIIKNQSNLSFEDICTPDNRIKSQANNGCYICRFLDPTHSVCNIYALRPFECYLYPFVVVKKNSAPYLAVHKQCPSIQRKYQSEEYERYKEYLKTFFTYRDILDFINENRSQFGDYTGFCDELEYLFAII